MKRLLVLLYLMLVPVLSFASIETRSFDNPVKEERYKVLIQELRCLVCQNQNIADSNAELAQDMRRKTYELVQGGATHEDVIHFMVERYGDFVLYRPSFKLSTYLLWVGPFLFLLGGVLATFLLIRKLSKNRSYSPDRRDLNRVRSLLGDTEVNS